jgi:class 3 adenylate cyclase
MRSHGFGAVTLRRPVTASSRCSTDPRAPFAARRRSWIARALGIEVRAGVHTGECETRGDDFSGIAVHIGAGVCDLAVAGEVLATSTVRDLVAGSGIEFVERHAGTLRGLDGRWTIFAVKG